VRFLVVDDDERIQRSLRRALGRYGEVLIAGSIAEAEDIRATVHIDGLIADYLLPDGLGFELLDPKRGPRPFSLLVSGHFEKDILARAHELGVLYVTKPLSGEQLDLFANRVRERVSSRADRLAHGVAAWKERYGLTDAETRVLHERVSGTLREDLPRVLGVKRTTVDTYAKHIVEKTGDRTLEIAIARFHAELPA
jgi:DNA-binding response OmpR family regulator